MQAPNGRDATRDLRRPTHLVHAEAVVIAQHG